MNKNAKTIYDRANKLAWPIDTPKNKYAWKGGKATDAFKKELAKQYPKHNNWSAAPSKGCSCDVGVAVVVKPILKGYPRGLEQQQGYKSSKVEIHTSTNITPWSMIKKYCDDTKDCAVIIQYWRSNGQHTMLYVGGRLFEAGLKKTYFHRRKAGKLKTKRKKVRILIIK